MSVIKKVTIGSALLLAVFLVWLLLIRSYDLRFKFKVVTLPEIANATLRTWSAAQSSKDQIKYDIENLRTEQILSKDGVDYVIVWEVIGQKDSTVTISASISSQGNRIQNRIGSMLFSTQIKKDGELIVKDFYTKLNEHLKKIKVEVVGFEEVDKQRCLCIASTTSQFGKAYGMMANFQYLSGEILGSEISTTGDPMVIVNDWNEQEDVLKYDFCFPVKEEKDLSNTDFFYRTLEATAAIKAVYNGNYITSDRAWYALRRYAIENDLEIVGNPIEIFYNNPNIESEETTWRADIYMPIVNKQGR